MITFILTFLLRLKIRHFLNRPNPIEIFLTSLLVTLSNVFYLTWAICSRGVSNCRG